MRVLLISKTLAEYPEEAGKVREISKLGVEIAVLVPLRWLGKPVDITRLRSDGYEVIPRDCRFNSPKSRRIRYHCHFYPEISEILAKCPWDLVHVDEEPMNFVTYHTVRECRKRRLRAVFTTWQNLMKRYPPPFDFFERYIFENSAGGFAGNDEAAKILRRRGFEKPVACVPQHGVDSNIFRRLDASELRKGMGLQNTFLIGFVGQIAFRKGLDTLVKAFAMLPKDCALVLVGAGPDAPRFKALADELGLSSRVRWKPWCDQQDIVRYMCAFDVFVLPSRTQQTWKEQFGRVLIEAMACETPVIGSDSGEIPKVIGGAGLVFAEDDEKELAGHLRRLMDDSSFRKDLGRRGRERVLEHFTNAKIAAQNVDFYNLICSADDLPCHRTPLGQLITA